MRVRGVSRLYSNYLAKFRGPFSVLLQGMLIALIGVILLVVNFADSYGQIKTMSGHLVQDYIRTDNGEYNASLIQIDTGNQIFIFDGTAMQPEWSDDAPPIGQKLEVYYEDDVMPYKVLAIQLYDSSGNPSILFATPGFKKGSTTYQKTTVDPAIGTGVLLFGLFVALIGAVLVYMRTRDRRLFPQKARPFSSLSLQEQIEVMQSRPYKTPPPSYVSPTAIRKLLEEEKKAGTSTPSDE
jgi:hypothetical protein